MQTTVPDSDRNVSGARRRRGDAVTAAGARSGRAEPANAHCGSSSCSRSLPAAMPGTSSAASRNRLRSDIAQRLTAADAAAAQARARESDLGNELRDAQAKLALLEARVAEFQSQQAALEALYRELAPSRDELALAEVEQILVLASQQLSLGGNVQAALAGLQVADGKLARLDRPQLAPLRRALARDMDRLKAVPYVDVAGISIKLDQVIGAIDALPLAKDERLPPPRDGGFAGDDPAWLRFLRDLWNDLRSVIRVEVSDRPAAPLITPQQSFFLRENLRLRLLSARLALLSRDERAFRADLQAASGWLKQYFDLQSKPVQAALATLAQQSAVADAGRDAGPRREPRCRPHAEGGGRANARACRGAAAQDSDDVVRALIAFLLIAAAAVTLALLFRLNTGYVLFVAPPYRVELSQNAFIIIACWRFSRSMR